MTIGKTSPTIRKRMAFLGLRSLLTAHAIGPPTIPEKIAKTYHQFETFSGIIGCSTPHFGHILAFMSISAPQLEQNLVFFSSGIKFM